MECHKCVGKGWILVCSNCGEEISVYYDEENGELYDYCIDCELNEFEHEAIERPCESCSGKDNSIKPSFNSLFEEAISEYKYEFGVRKYNKIQQKVINSNRVVETLLNYKDYTKPPSIEGILSMLCSIPFFGFGPKRNLAIGGVIFIYMWNYGCNKNNSVLDDEGVINLMGALFERTSRMM